MLAASFTNLGGILSGFVALFEFKDFMIFFIFPIGIYLFKVNNRNTRARCEIYSKLTGVFTVNFEHISHFILVLLLLTLCR